MSINSIENSEKSGSSSEESELFQRVRAGARRDGVEITHYRPRFTESGSAEEKRIERVIAGCFGATGLAGLAFFIIFFWWPHEYEMGSNPAKYYTPLLGICLCIALLGIGFGVIIWAKKLLPEEVAVQDRHDGGSEPDEVKYTAATLVSALEATGVKRRPLLKKALAFGLAPAGLAAVAPLGALITKPGNKLYETGWKKGVRLTQEDGSFIRPDDVSAGGQITVFPDIEGGRSNKHADSPTLLIHLRSADAEKVKKRPGYENANFGNFYAYSKICTHAGCPASLYEQQTQRMLCPCHQSQFDVLDGCRPVFGPATRSLPQLPITVDKDGYFIANSDYLVAVGPAFWERP